MELLISHDCGEELDDAGGCFLAVALISTSHVTHTLPLIHAALWCDLTHRGNCGGSAAQLFNKKTHILTQQPHISEDREGLQQALVRIPRPHDCKRQNYGGMRHICLSIDKFSELKMRNKVVTFQI